MPKEGGGTWEWSEGEIVTMAMGLLTPEPLSSSGLPELLVSLPMPSILEEGRELVEI